MASNSTIGVVLSAHWFAFALTFALGWFAGRVFRRCFASIAADPITAPKRRIVEPPKPGDLYGYRSEGFVNFARVVEVRDVRGYMRVFYYSWRDDQDEPTDRPWVWDDELRRFLSFRERVEAPNAG